MYPYCTDTLDAFPPAAVKAETDWLVGSRKALKHVVLGTSP